MFYPIYVYAEEGCAYSATFPDIPGCFTAADELKGLQAAAQKRGQSRSAFLASAAEHEMASA